MHSEWYWLSNMRVKNISNYSWTRANSNAAAIAPKLESFDINTTDTNKQKRENNNINNNHPRNMWEANTKSPPQHRICITIVIKQSACKQSFCFFHFRSYFLCALLRSSSVLFLCKTVHSFCFFGRANSVFVCALSCQHRLLRCTSSKI